MKNSGDEEKSGSEKIDELNERILADEYEAASQIYDGIRDGIVTREDLTKYVDHWRKLETVRMSIGSQFDRTKLWQTKVPSFASKDDDGDDFGGLDDVQLAQEGRLLATEVMGLVKGVRHFGERIKTTKAKRSRSEKKEEEIE